MLDGRGLRWLATWFATGCALAAQVGCADDEEQLPHPPDRQVSVAELPELQIAVVYGFEQAIDAPHRMLRLSIDYGNGRDPLQDPGTGQYYCPQLLPSFSAELAGVALSIDNPGGWRPWLTGNFKCERPSASLAVPSDLHVVNAELVLGDDSFALTVSLGNALLERTAQPAGGAGWSFQAGQPVTFTWSPATDLAALPDTAATFLTTSNFRAFQLAGEIARGLDSLSFTLPNVTGEGTLFLELSDDRPRPCGEHCTIRSVSQAAYHAVTIAP